MISLLNKILKIFGYAIYSKRILKTYNTDIIKEKYKIDDFDIAYIKAKIGIGLNAKLIAENRCDWLDIGCGKKFEENFKYLDKFPIETIEKKDLYVQADIVNITNDDIQKIGKFDLIRMQHVFEHFTPEDGLKVLENCSKLLKTDGYILISTPDLNKFIGMYLNSEIRNYYDWAKERIDVDSPDSFYFSIFTHSVMHEKHEWCYDAKGLIYQLEKSGKFKNIQELSLDNELANIPFTHNRPIEDVCVLAQLK